MEIHRVSGETFAVSEDEFLSMVEDRHTVGDLKRFLAVGWLLKVSAKTTMGWTSCLTPSFIRALFERSVQLLIRGFCCPHEGEERALLRACERNDI